MTNINRVLEIAENLGINLNFEINIEGCVYDKDGEFLESDSLILKYGIIRDNIQE